MSNDEQMYAVVQGVRVPVMVVDGVEIPTALLKGYTNPDGSPAQIQVHDASVSGNTFTFWVKDPTYGLDTKNTIEYDPRATEY